MLLHGCNCGFPERRQNPPHLLAHPVVVRLVNPPQQTQQRLKSLPKEDCKTIGADILTVQYVWPVGKPLVDNLGGGIWEIQAR